MKIVVREAGKGTLVSAEDGKRVIGEILLGEYRTRHNTPYLRVDTAYAPISSGVGTKLYEAALRYACDERKMVLRSDTLRSVFAESFWRKQVAKGRATCTGGRGLVFRAPEGYYPGKVRRRLEPRIGKRGGRGSVVVNEFGEYWPCAYYEAQCAAHRLDGTTVKCRRRRQ